MERYESEGSLVVASGGQECVSGEFGIRVRLVPVYGYVDELLCLKRRLGAVCRVARYTNSLAAFNPTVSAS